MNCRHATRLLSEAQERELSLSELASLKFHTAMCVGCRNFGRQIQTLRKISRAYTLGAGMEEPEKTEGRSGDGDS
ncbi:hypothetical protein FHS09_000711 [Microbulbifer rhizosphaerae]|uniref:Putative zinc-finger domain-containing protein n=1 Tax=Microbulbifer rhizosphaerae TaxID=1562603 RepID=A0A7W4WA30_9GAMM|nr:hypothetical protein [Microbulbifer rhizosphaerae]